jgi:endoglucanase
MAEPTDEHSVDLLRRLTLAPGAPGAEGAVRDVVRDALGSAAGLSLQCDRLGSLVIDRAAAVAGPRVLLDAHLDEVGFMVQAINEDGNLAFVPLGGWWSHVLLAQRVDILTEKGPVPGVIGSTPPHFLNEESRSRLVRVEEMFIDIGATDLVEAERLGVRVGDPVVPHAEFLRMANPRILSSKAFDNRVGVALLVETLLALEGRELPNHLIGVGAVQEEVGCRGASTAVRLARPDVAIVLEGTPADDLPGFTLSQGALGKGPQLRFFDPTALSNRALLRFVREVAALAAVPVQIAVRRSGGTDARSVQVHEAGVPTVVIGVPARYIHTHVSLIDLDDFLAARQLVIALVEQLDESTVESFFPR